MFKCSVNTDFNGIVLFDPYRLIEFFGGAIASGADLFTLFRTSDVGDQVLQAGIVIPILAIDDAGYSLEVLIDEESARPLSDIQFSNGIFPLHIQKKLVVADLAVFKEWEEDTGWIETPVSEGFYAATVRGFRTRNEQGHIVDCGYEVSLKTVTEMPILSGSTSINARVFD